MKRESYQKWLRNTLIFLAPLFILYLTFASDNITKDGFDWHDFTADKEITGAVALYVLNVLIDFFRKLLRDAREMPTLERNS